MINTPALINLISRSWRKNRAPALGMEAPRLQKLGEMLTRFNAETEQEFLTIGGNLQDLSGGAREISQAAAATAGIIGGQEMQEAIAALDHIFQETKLLEGECQKDTDILSEILQTLNVIQAAVTGFGKIVKTLAVLGTFIRVESARLGNIGTDFLTLANEINQLGQGIDEKCRNIFDQSQSLSSLLTTSLENVVKIRASQQGQVQVVMDKIMASLGSLMERQRSASDTAAQISGNYQHLAGNISNIVMSLQFHDITRQQIEHVDQALQNVATLVNDDNQENGQPAQPLILAQHICRIQEAQLTIARDKLTQAVEAIIGNLTSIATGIDVITRQVQELAGDATRDGQSFLVEMEAYLAAVAEGLNLYGLARQDLLKLMAEVAPALTDMAAFLLDIERIEIAIERIALNACIKAAHLGKVGASLGVLAEATQGLVGDTREQTRQVSGSLNSIKATAQQLSAGEGEAGGRGDVDVAFLITELGAVLKTLDGINEGVIAALTRVDRKAEGLSAGLTQTAGGITVHEYAREVLDHVIAGIRELADRFQAQLPENSAATLSSEELAGLKAQYTMMDEHQVHDQILLSPSAPVTEDRRAPDDGGKTVMVADQGEEADLGDNVELF